MAIIQPMRAPGMFAEWWRLRRIIIEIASNSNLRRLVLEIKAFPRRDERWDLHETREAIKCAIAWIRLWFTRRNDRRKLNVFASLTVEVLEQTEEENISLRQSKMGKFVGRHWLKLEKPQGRKRS